MEKAILIMAGGSGSRLWPLTRKNRPKQSHRMFSNVSTFDRLLKMLLEEIPLENIYVTVGESQYDYISKSGILTENILYQKENKNTGPAVLFGLHQIKKQLGNCLVAMVPSDHLILEDDLYKDALWLAFSGAKSKEQVVTIGTKPVYPSSGFGYIEVADNSPGLKEVIRFKEKPSKDLACQYMDKHHLWNSGIYVSRMDTLMSAYETFLPDTYACLKDEDSFYHEAESISLDYGITEKLERIMVVVSQHTWMDMGTYDFLEHFMEKDSSGNIIQGKGQAVDSSSTTIISEVGQVVTFGTQELLVVNTEDVVFVCDKKLIQKIGRLVEKLEEYDGGKLL